MMKLYRAIVVSNADSKKTGKVTLDIKGLSGATSVAATVLGSTAFGLSNGIGVSSVLRPGTWVMVILEGDDPNRPVVIGTITTPGDMGDNTVGQYPACQSIKTESGHTITLDGAGGNDIEIKHTSGAVIQFSGPNILIDAQAGGGNVTIKGVRIDLNP